MEIIQHATGEKGARRSGDGHTGGREWNLRRGFPDLGVSMSPKGGGLSFQIPRHTGELVHSSWPRKCHCF